MLVNRYYYGYSNKKKHRYTRKGFVDFIVEYIQYP